MKELNKREHELVALGAAIASNCVPCIEYHIPEARKAGLSDAQILEAVLIADKIKQVPARKVLDGAKTLLNSEQTTCTSANCGCEASAENAESAANKSARPDHMMMEMMSRMSNAWSANGQTGAVLDGVEKASSGSPTANIGCGCR